jgi:hypothetical protein
MDPLQNHHEIILGWYLLDDDEFQRRVDAPPLNRL